MMARWVLAAAFVGAGCGLPDFTRQPNREGYLRDKVEEDLKKSFGCDNTAIHFQSAEQRSGEWYDYYVAEGCGQRSEYVTKLRHTSSGGWPNSDVVSWDYGAVPSISQYKSASETQMTKTAKFDLACDAVEIVELKEAIEPMHTLYRASIGARGCNKQLSYEVMCNHTGYVNGMHQITCTSMASGQGKP